MDQWRAVGACKGGVKSQNEAVEGLKTNVAGSHHFDEAQDPDPDPDPH